MFHKKSNALHLLLCICLGTIYISGQAFAMLPETLDVYEKAILANSLVQKIHEEGLQHRQEEERQLTRIQKNVCENRSKDSEQLRNNVIQSLEQDGITFEIVNQQLKAGSYKPGERGATFQILNNRMPFINEEAIKLAKNGNVFFEILDGNLPEGYSIKAPLFNYFPDNTHIYSNGKRGNALKSLLLKTWQIQNDKSSLSELRELFGPSWLDSSPFVHITPFPDDFDVSSLQSSPHFFSDAQTPKALLTIHNGYAFGGHRNEPRYPKGKPWGPHDCSSFTAMYTRCKSIFSTYDQAQYYQHINGFQFKEIVEQAIAQQWDAEEDQRKNDACIKHMSEVLLPLHPNPDPQSLKPGLVHAERYYPGVSSYHKTALTGKGGHTGIYLGTIGSAEETQALTLSTQRDLEKTGREFSYGVEKRPFLSTPEHMVMFFDIKD